MEFLQKMVFEGAKPLFVIFGLDQRIHAERLKY